MVVVDQEKIIEISRYGFGRFHQCVNVKLITLRKRGEGSREHALLNPVCDAQLRTDPLLLLRNGSQVLHILDNVHLHIPEFRIQVTDLIVMPVREFNDLGFQVLRVLKRSKGTCFACQSADGICDEPADVEVPADRGKYKNRNADKDHDRHKPVPPAHDCAHVQIRSYHCGIAAIRCQNGFRAGTQPSKTGTGHHGVHPDICRPVVDSLLILFPHSEGKQGFLRVQEIHIVIIPQILYIEILQL